MIKASKPRPDIYLLACSRMEKAPGECYALEDSKNGVLSASSAGCRTIMVPDLWQPDEAFLQNVFACFKDLDQVREFLMEQDG